MESANHFEEVQLPRDHLCLRRCLVSVDHFCQRALVHHDRHQREHHVLHKDNLLADSESVRQKVTGRNHALPMHQPTLFHCINASFLHSTTRATSGMAERSSACKMTCCRGPLWTQLISYFDVALTVAQRGRHTPLVELSSFPGLALISSCADSLLLTTIVEFAIAMCAPQHSPQAPRCTKGALNCGPWHAA
ncbi:hypothetical protein U1Q18_044777 [Sarracenia purpurea var. burkii]